MGMFHQILRKARRQYTYYVTKKYYSTILAYIHIPKTGGTYIGQRESNRKPVIWPVEYLGHITVVDRRGQPNFLYYPRDPENSYKTILHQEIKKYCVFSTVRNPFDWLVSYAGHAGGWNPKYVDPDHYDFENAQKGFEYLLKTIADRETPWPSRKFLFFQLFCSNGDLVVDWITRKESLDDDLRHMAKSLKVVYRKQQRQREGEHKDYRFYYSDELREIVEQTWGRELMLFGYNFDGVDRSSGRLVNKIDSQMKQSIYYHWIEDRLVVHNYAPGD